MKTMRFRAMPAALAVVGLMAAGAVAPAPAQEPAASTAPAVDLDEATIKAFAVASLEVEALNKKYLPQIEATESSDEQEALRQQALAEMTAAVESAGLEVDTYNQIADAAKADEGLATRIVQYREELQ